MEARQKECQQILQDGFPTFVPALSSLRAACLQRTCEQLRTLETQIEHVDDGPERHILLEQATALLSSLEKQFSAIADRHQLEDPEYAAQRGLSITHFTLESGENKGHWMLLASNRSADSKSITESDPAKLASVRREYLKEFCGGVLPSIVAFNRQRTLIERQRGAVVEDGKLLVPNPRVKMLWSITLGLGYAASICFLGVGIIATTATFSPTFVKYFFWIAILWLLASSSLLVLIVRAFGANGKDCMSAFLAAVAIWLVIIQIGQTKLNGQLQDS
jgi:hypothetical protein